MNTPQDIIADLKTVLDVLSSNPGHVWTSASAMMLEGIAGRLRVAVEADQKSTSDPG